MLKVGADVAVLLARLGEGARVTVRKDDGSSFDTCTRSDPWKLSHGAWVVLLDGIPGGYDCARITNCRPPLVKDQSEQSNSGDATLREESQASAAVRQAGVSSL